MREAEAEEAAGGSCEGERCAGGSARHMNTEPPTISERSREKSNVSPRCVATAIPVNTSCETSS
jgi:hypothetical protein